RVSEPKRLVHDHSSQASPRRTGKRPDRRGQPGGAHDRAASPRLTGGRVRSTAALGASLLGVAAGVSGGVQAARAAAAPVALDASSPWPEMRHDPRNTGASPIAARYGGDRPWVFKTGRGVFSTPVIAGDG